MGNSKPALWSATIAALGAIGALAFGGWQSCVAQRHYAVSVQPRLVSEPTVGGEGQPTQVSLENVGLGPAIIVWTEVRFKGNPPPSKKYAGWPALIEEAKQIRLPPKLDRRHYSSDDALRAGYKVNLFGWDEAITDRCQRERFRELLKDAEYRVCYKSLSNHRWTFISRLYGSRKTIEGCAENPAGSYGRTPELQRMSDETSEDCRTPTSFDGGPSVKEPSDGLDASGGELGET